jgi:hypothetical protein
MPTEGSAAFTDDGLRQGGTMRRRLVPVSAPAVRLRRVTLPSGCDHGGGALVPAVRASDRDVEELLAERVSKPRIVMQILRHTQFDVAMEMYASASSEATWDALTRLGASLVAETRCCTSQLYGSAAVRTDPGEKTGQALADMSF